MQRRISEVRDYGFTLQTLAMRKEAWNVLNSTVRAIIDRLLSGETAASYHEYLLPKYRLTAADCAYTLKYVELSRQKRPERPWAERQTTIATHRSEISAWLLISPSTPMQEYLDRYMRGLNEDEPENSFAIHLLFIEAAMINWQAYMAFLTHETNEGVSNAPSPSTSLLLTHL